MLKILYRICVVAIILFLAIILESPGYLEPLRKYFIVHILRSFLLIFLIVTLGNAFSKYVIKNERIKEWIKNSLLSVFVVVILILIVEIVFTFLPVSHTTSRTLAGQNWMYYFWKENSMGYRDAELSQKNNSKKKIFFIGDSFTAGHGLKKRSQRFSDIAGKKLQTEFEFYNLGVNGADTDDEYKNLINFPEKPDVVVLQYFYNDIDNASKRADKWEPFPIPYDDISDRQRPFIKGSFLLNFIYWKFPHSNEFNYEKYLTTVYSDSAVLADHLSSLKKFVDYSRENNVRLFVIIFPFLQDLNSSNLFAAPVKKFFDEQKIEVIDAGNLSSDIPAMERVVNRHDFHGSPLVNQRVADALVSLVNKNQ